MSRTTHSAQAAKRLHQSMLALGHFATSAAACADDDVLRRVLDAVAHLIAAERFGSSEHQRLMGEARRLGFVPEYYDYASWIRVRYVKPQKESTQ